MSDPVTFLNSALQTIATATSLSKALIAERDRAIVEKKTRELTEMLLDAREALLTQRQTFLDLLDDKLKMQQQIRELTEAAGQRSRYPLVDVGNGQLAYRVDVAPQESGTSAPRFVQAPHYICQQCLSRGMESILQPRFERGVDIGLFCGGCSKTLLNDAGIAYASTPDFTGAGIKKYRSI